MIDTKIMDDAGGLCTRGPESRGMPLSEESRNENGDACLCRFSYEQRWEIISAYLEVLERLVSSMGVESDLPYSKGQIRFAIFQELAENPSSEFRYQLEIAYMQLESFIPYEDYKTVADFKYASFQAEGMADPGDPTSVIKSAGIMRKVKGDRAVRIQEAVSQKMRERFAQIREIGVADCLLNCLLDNSPQVCS